MTILIKKLRIKYPIIQAPMAGGVTTPELVAAVSNYGGIGSLGAGYMEPEDIRATIRKIRKLTDKPFAVNLFIPQKAKATSLQIKNMQEIIRKVCPSFDLNNPIQLTPYIPDFNKQLQIIVEEKVPIFSFTFGMLFPEQIEYLKQEKIITIGTATNVPEATVLESLGIDIIVAQGSEAGGHRGSFLNKGEYINLIGLMSLVPQVAENVKIPIIAAGGIMDGRGVKSIMSLGASGAAIGTAFLTTHESGIHPKYKKALLKYDHDFTVLTRAFSGKLARGVYNTFIKRMEKYADKILDYPIQNKLTQQIRKEANIKNDVEFMSMWAGQGMPFCKAQSVAELMQELCYSSGN